MTVALTVLLLFAAAPFVTAQQPPAGEPAVQAQEEQTREQGEEITPAQDSEATQRERTSTTTTWYASPLWIALGIVALVLLILLFALPRRADRGERTTVIKT